MSDSYKFDPTALSDAARKVQEKFFLFIRQQQAVNRMWDVHVAEKAGLTGSYYSMLQSCKRPLSINHAAAIAGVFGFDVTYTLTPKDETES